MRFKAGSSGNKLNLSDLIDEEFVEQMKLDGDDGEAIAKAQEITRKRSVLAQAPRVEPSEPSVP